MIRLSWTRESESVWKCIQRINNPRAREREESPRRCEEGAEETDEIKGIKQSTSAFSLSPSSSSSCCVFLKRYTYIYSNAKFPLTSQNYSNVKKKKRRTKMEKRLGRCISRFGSLGTSREFSLSHIVCFFLLLGWLSSFFSRPMREPRARDAFN